MQDGLEAAQVALGESGERAVLEHCEVLMHPRCSTRSAAGESHGEGAAVLGPHVAGNVPASLEAVQVAGEAGALVGERLVQLAHRAGACLRQMREEMSLSLRETERRLGSLQVQADSVGGAVNEGDQLEPWLHDGFG